MMEIACLLDYGLAAAKCVGPFGSLFLVIREAKRETVAREKGCCL